MEREARFVETKIAATAAESDVIDATWPAGAGLITPAALEASTKIAFKVSPSKDGEFLPLYDESNVLVEVTVTLDAAKAYALPDAVFAWPYFKLWTEAAGVDVAQTTERTFLVVLKS